MLSSVEAQSPAQKGASPCNTQDDCPTVLCCGWAVPMDPMKGFKTKICHKPQETTYINVVGDEFAFACDPKTNRINMNAEDYAARFWVDMKKDGPMNIPGYGPERPYVPPIQQPESLIAIYDKWSLTSQFSAGPLFVAFWAWVYNLPSGDGWDGFWYNNAIASGDQVYPTGLSKYYDVHSIDGIFTYTFYWIWVVLQKLFIIFTLEVPLDVWLAIFNGASMEGLWKIFIFYYPFSSLSGAVPSFVAEYFGVEMIDGWGILNN